MNFAFILRTVAVISLVQQSPQAIQSAEDQEEVIYEVLDESDRPSLVIKTKPGNSGKNTETASGTAGGKSKAAKAAGATADAAAKAAGGKAGAPKVLVNKPKERKIPRLDEFLQGMFTPACFEGEWISDTEYLEETDGVFFIRNVESGTEMAILPPEVIRARRLMIKKVHVSANKKFALLQLRSRPVFRQSSLSTYGLLELPAEGSNRSSNASLEEILTPFPAKDTFLRLVSWAPVGGAVVYVSEDNNLYFRKSGTSDSVQLSKDGQPGVVFCGIPDWVYEEEINDEAESIWWSPNARMLAYAVYNDTEVETMQYELYGHWRNLQDFQYPKMEKVKYPKAGTRNPTVELRIVRLYDEKDSVKHEVLDPPKGLSEPILTKVVWLTNTSLLANWMNRVQNRSITLLCRVGDVIKCHKDVDKSQKNGWMEKDMQFTPNPNGTDGSYILLLPDDTKDQFMQIFFVKNNTLNQITFHAGDVVKIHAWTAEGYIFYQATGERDRTSRHLFRIGLEGKSSLCLTCKKRHNCGYAEVVMSEKGSYYVLKCKGPRLPFSLLLTTKDNTGLRLLQANKELSVRLREYTGWDIVRLKIGKADVELTLPKGVDLDSKQRLPALVYVYGGPGSQEVTKNWNDEGILVRYMVTTQNLIGIKMDVSGSGFQGMAYKARGYRNLGVREVQDILKVTVALQKKIKIIDPTKTGIFGWSFGGFLSLSTLVTDDQAIFCCGVSVAPVAMWELYDSMYTERFMSTPADNPTGYNKSNPLWKIDNLRFKRFLLMHGTLDDNVHFQQSMFIAEALEEKDILFRQMAYPDQNHSMGRMVMHLFHTVAEFFAEAFRSPAAIKP